MKYFKAALLCLSITINISFLAGNEVSSFAFPSAPEVSITPDFIKQNEFSSVELKCTASGIPSPLIKWSRNDGAKISHEAVVNGGFLRINSLRKSDEGIYRCLATNDEGEDEKVVRIYVRDQRIHENPSSEVPNIEIHPKRPQKRRVGESARMTCRVIGGHPYPTITWTRRGGVQLSTRFTEDYPGVITLRGATIEDSDVYECIARNDAGETRLSSTIEITQRPSITLEPDRETLVLIEGDELRFTCTAHGIPTPSIRIEVPKNSNVRVPNDIDNHNSKSLSIQHQNIKQSQAGVYTCIASSEAGEDRRYVQVDVSPQKDLNARTPNVHTDNSTPHFPPNIFFEPAMPVIVKEGENVMIYCNSKGEDPIRVHWHDEGGNELPRTVDVQGSYLSISKITRQLEGRYFCTASNSYGNTTKLAEVIVNKNFQVLGEDDQFKGKNKEAYEGDQVSLQCFDDNLITEFIRYEWEREDENLPPNIDRQGNTLIIQNLRMEDSGRYICRGFDKNGKKSESSVDLFVEIKNRNQSRLQNLNLEHEEELIL